MLKSGWRIGSLCGIPIVLDLSWFYILAIVTLWYGLDWQNAGWNVFWAWATGLAMALMLFGSVLLHELGHSLVAQHQGISVTSIKLFLFGGVASIAQESQTPARAFQVAIAGPIASFGLFLLLLLLSWLPLAAPAAAIFSNLAGINLVLALFNMIPGLPLDGGQVLKAAVWQMTGSRSQGIRWAARAGIGLGSVAIVLGILGYITSFFLRISFLWLALIGWFIIRNARSYSHTTDLQEALLHLKTSDALSLFEPIEMDLPLANLTDRLQSQPHRVYFATQNGQYQGFLCSDRLTPRDPRSAPAQIADITQPFTDLPPIAPETSLALAIQQLETQQVPRLCVIDASDQVLGVIDRGDIVRAVANWLKTPVTDAAIDQIKASAAFPAGLPLDQVAESVMPLATSPSLQQTPAPEPEPALEQEPGRRQPE